MFSTTLGSTRAGDTTQSSSKLEVSERRHHRTMATCAFAPVADGPSPLNTSRITSAGKGLLPDAGRVFESMYTAKLCNELCYV